MGAVISFDRVDRLIADMKPDAVRRQARITARISNCRRVEILAVDAEAAELIKAGEPNHSVLERCESLARELVNQRNARVPA